jgi:hypothetical protein
VDEYTLVIIIVAEIGCVEQQQLDVQQHLIVSRCIVLRTAVVLVNADHVAVAYHAVFIVVQPFALVEGGIEEE